MKSKYTSSTSTRQEANARTSRIKTATKLASRFAKDYGEFRPGGSATSFLKCTVLGYEVRLRLGYAWTAYCSHFDTEVQFTNRPDADMLIFLSSWLQAHIDRPQTPAAQLRQATPAVLYLADCHDICEPLADEIMRGR